MDTDVLEQYAQLLQSGQRAKSQLQRMVKAHKNAIMRLINSQLELQSAKLEAKKALKEHMEQLQSKLNNRYRQALTHLEQEFELQQLPLQSSMQLLDRSISALELSAHKVQSGLQPSPSQSVRHLITVMQDIHTVMQQGAAAVEHSSSQAASSSQQGIACTAVQQFLQLRVTSKDVVSSSSWNSNSRSPQHMQQEGTHTSLDTDVLKSCKGALQLIDCDGGPQLSGAEQQDNGCNCHAACSSYSINSSFQGAYHFIGHGSADSKWQDSPGRQGRQLKHGQEQQVQQRWRQTQKCPESHQPGSSFESWRTAPSPATCGALLTAAEAARELPYMEEASRDWAAVHTAGRRHGGAQRQQNSQHHCCSTPRAAAAAGNKPGTATGSCGWQDLGYVACSCCDCVPQ